MKIPVIIMFFIFFAVSVHPQNQAGSISGKIIDSASKEPIQYVNAILFSASADTNSGKQVTGTVTMADGIFELTPVRPGNYYIEIQFISYEKKRIDNIAVTVEKKNIDLGTIEIKGTAVNLTGVTVEGQRSSISYQIDKKVIDVDQMSTTVSGNAADVLQNVPSVTVDIDGNVSLRGSTNFKVLVDGRPSVLDPQDVLQQIPASSIDNIELITNPSAKYDPEGSAGIINIILKKSNNVGISGVSNLNAGFKDKYGGDFLAEYKTSSLSANLGLDYNNMIFPGTGISENRTTFNGNNSYINSNGSSSWGRKMYGLRSGLNFNLGTSDFLNIGGRYGSRDMIRKNAQSFDEWNDAGPIHNFYLNNSHFNRGGHFYALNMNYNHKFGAPDPNSHIAHEITSEFSYRYSNSDENTYTELFSEGILNNGIHSTENGPENQVEGKIDYTLPFSASSKFEAGYDGEVEISKDNIGFYQTNPGGIYEFYPQFSHSTKSNQQQHAFYSIYSTEFDKLGLQGGLRVENTYRTIQVDQNQSFDINSWDLFPSIHGSYSIAEGHQVMASYTRRIQRPGGWSLEPFETWADANNVRKGNPALKPEYVDSYEGGVRTFVGGVSVSTELYYRINHNKIEEIRSAYADNVTLTTFSNVGADYSLGSELMFNFGFVKFWDINLMGNLYQYRIEGTLYDESFSRRSFNWNTRFNNTFKLGNTQLQINSFYNSPSVSSQGTREGFFSTDVAVKHELFNKALSLTLQVRDLFSTAKYEFTSSGPDFSSYNHWTRESPVVMLNIRFNINNYKTDERRNPDNNGGYEGGEGEF